MVDDEWVKGPKSIKYYKVDREYADITWLRYGISQLHGMLL